jgi:hypothetical protein
MCRNIRTLFNFEPPATALIGSLVTNAGPRDRGVESMKARARAAKRFATVK